MFPAVFPGLGPVHGGQVPRGHAELAPRRRHGGGGTGAAGRSCRCWGDPVGMPKIREFKGKHAEHGFVLVASKLAIEFLGNLFLDENVGNFGCLIGK